MDSKCFGATISRMSGPCHGRSAKPTTPYPQPKPHLTTSPPALSPISPTASANSTLPPSPPLSSPPKPPSSTPPHDSHTQPPPAYSCSPDSSRWCHKPGQTGNQSCSSSSPHLHTGSLPTSCRHIGPRPWCRPSRSTRSLTRRS
jgi:hypothetical protein